MQPGEKSERAVVLDSLGFEYFPKFRPVRENENDHLIIVEDNDNRNNYIY